MSEKKKWKAYQVAEATCGKVIFGSEDKCFQGISTHSGKVKEGELFIPLMGEKLNAHNFLEEGVKNRCGGFLISDDSFLELAGKLAAEYKDLAIIRVGDTTGALQAMARFYLAEMKAIKIGITGSNGKTTTKEMISVMCAEAFKTAANPGNFNNHIGLPLSVLDFPKDTEVCVLEMGMSEFGEIEKLAEIVKPDIGVITTVGSAHIENLGSEAGILKAKLEIAHSFGRGNVLVINGDNQLLAEGAGYKRDAKGFSLVEVGFGEKNDYKIMIKENRNERGVDFYVAAPAGPKEKSKEVEKKAGKPGELSGRAGLTEISISLPGLHNVSNGGLAFAVGMVIGMEPETAARGIAKAKATDKRLSVKEKAGVKIIDDSYNASLDSMKAAIDVLAGMEGERKIAVFGDMLEIGGASREYHLQVGQYLARKLGEDLHQVMTVGENSRYIGQGAEEARGEKAGTGIVSNHFDQNKELAAVLKAGLVSGDIVLVKGSRGMATDEIVQYLLED